MLFPRLECRRILLIRRGICLSPFGLSESLLKPLFSGSHWVSRTSACENCCCDFLLSLRIDVCQRDAAPWDATTTCYWSREYAL